MAPPEPIDISSDDPAYESMTPQQSRPTTLYMIMQSSQPHHEEDFGPETPYNHILYESLYEANLAARDAVKEARGHDDDDSDEDYDNDEDDDPESPKSAKEPVSRTVPYSNEVETFNETHEDEHAVVISVQPFTVRYAKPQITQWQASNSNVHSNVGNDKPSTSKRKRG